MENTPVEELKARHAKACDLKHEVDKPAIVEAMREWIVAIGATAETRISFIASVAEMMKVGRAAWAARDAWAAWAAWDARAAWGAWGARAAWGASFNLDYLSIAAIGAVAVGDNKTASIWMPTLRAFEAGAFAAWVTTDEVFVATNPTVVKVDDERRLHCETGPAFVWMEGIEDYYWHGTNIPKEWITDKSSLTATAAITWPNLEQRRVACSDIVGWSRVLRELDARTIDDDGDPMIGTLVEVDLPDLPRPARFCRVKCGTGREFAIGVPPEIRTALEAQAWMQNRPLTDYVKPEVRT